MALSRSRNLSSCSALEGLQNHELHFLQFLIVFLPVNLLLRSCPRHAVPLPGHLSVTAAFCPIILRSHPIILRSHSIKHSHQGGWVEVGRETSGTAYHTLVLSARSNLAVNLLGMILSQAPGVGLRRWLLHLLLRWHSSAASGVAFCIKFLFLYLYLYCVSKKGHLI